jgi:hypothetical protein
MKAGWAGSYRQIMTGSDWENLARTVEVLRARSVVPEVSGCLRCLTERLANAATQVRNVVPAVHPDGFTKERGRAAVGLD